MRAAVVGVKGDRNLGGPVCVGHGKVVGKQRIVGKGVMVVVVVGYSIPVRAPFYL